MNSRVEHGERIAAYGNFKLQISNFKHQTSNIKLQTLTLYTAKIFLALTALALSGCASVRVVARETNPVEKEIFVEQCGWSSDLEGKKTEIRVSERGTIGAVTVHYNFFYALGTLVSLGHWMPFQITYEVNE